MMLTLRASAWLSFLAPALCWQCLLVAAETPVPAIPVGADFVVRVSNLATTTGKLVSLVNELQPEAQIAGGEDLNLSWLTGGLLKQSGAYEVNSEAPGSDMDQGWEMDQDWWLYGWNLVGPDACFVVIIPAANPDDFQARCVRQREQNQDTSSDSLVYKNWVITGLKPAIEAVRQCLAGTTPSIESRFDAASLATFSQGDVGVLIDVHTLVAAAKKNNVDLSEVVSELASMPFELGSEMFSDLFDGATWQIDNDSTVARVYVRAIVAIAQVVADGDLFIASLTINEDTIQVEQYMTVNPESATASFFKSNPGSEMEALGSLPSSSGVYLGLYGDWKSKFFSDESLLKIAQGDAEIEDITDDEQKRNEAQQELTYGTIAIVYPMHPFDQGLLRSVTIKEVNSPELARDLSIERRKESTILLASSTTESSQPIRTTEKYGSLSVDAVAFPAPISNDGPAQVALNFSNIFYGAEGCTTRTTYLKDRIVAAVGGSKVRTAAAFRHIAESSGQSPAPEAGFTKMRQTLDKQANLLLLVDTGVLTAAAMHAWNSYATLMTQAEMMPVVMVAQMAIEGEMEEAMPVEAQIADAIPEKTDAKPLENLAEREIAEDGVADIQLGMQQVIKVADFEELTPKFDAKEIEKIGSTHALIGCSLKFEPSASRLRLVIPRRALRTVFEATEILSKKLEDFEGGEVEAIPPKKAVLED